MSFWSLENIKAATGGTWIARPQNAPSQTDEFDGLSIDSRTIKPNQVFLAIRGERTDGHQYLKEAVQAGARLLILDRAVAMPPELAKVVAALLVPDCGVALLRLAAAYRRTLENTHVIAVAGSNGKTTTVRLIHAALSGSLRGTASAKSFNNAVGVPLTILSAKRTDQYVVCEVGTNAPGEIAALAAVVEPDVAVITSIGREHLEGLGSISGVLQEEVSLLTSLRAEGCAVINADAPQLVETVRPLVSHGRKQSLVTFGQSDAADLRITQVEQGLDGLRFCLNDRGWFQVPLLGVHNACNAAAAVAVARRLGVEQSAIEAGLEAARGPEMRLERTAVGGVTFINDAYNANPESVLAALATFASLAGRTGGVKRRVLVLGDMLELGESAPEMHLEVGRAVAREYAADLIILVGPLSAHTAAGIGGSANADRIVGFESLEGHGAHGAASLLVSGDMVLLKASRRMALERLIHALRALQNPSPLAYVEPAGSAGGAEVRDSVAAAISGRDKRS